MSKWRERRALEAQRRAFASWESERDEAAALVRAARTFDGITTNDLLLTKGERVFLVVEGTSLVEDRKAAGHWEGRSSGISVPIGSIGGRSIRYHVGQSRGHYVQGTPVATAIDQGTTFITNKRVVFRGRRQTRECAYAKLIGFEHDPSGATVFSVSNRQKATVIAYGAEAANTFIFRLDLAVAHFRNAVPDLVAELEGQLEAVEHKQPQDPDAHALPSGEPAANGHELAAPSLPDDGQPWWTDQDVFKPLGLASRFAAEHVDYLGGWPQHPDRESRKFIRIDRDGISMAGHRSTIFTIPWAQIRHLDVHEPAEPSKKASAFLVVTTTSDSEVDFDIPGFTPAAMRSILTPVLDRLQAQRLPESAAAEQATSTPTSSGPRPLPAENVAEPSLRAEADSSRQVDEPATGPPVDTELTPEGSGDALDQIRRLAELRDEGILTEEEFAAKKAELLKRV
jgi:hypothetical protein